MNDLQMFLRMYEKRPQERKQFFSDLGYYTYALCELDDENRRKPIYIGKGKGDRCLQHLGDTKDSDKTRKINSLFTQNRLGIDILAYKLDEKTSFEIESVCIDLLNIKNLTNMVRGHGDNTKRLPINELANIFEKEAIDVLPEHKGLAFLLEKTYQHSFGDIELFEYTRGMWYRPSREGVKFAFATFRGIVKEVYEINCWVPANTQQYFTRVLDPEKVPERVEFVGKKAQQDVRDRYVGKLIKKKESYSSPFVRVGFD